MIMPKNFAIYFSDEGAYSYPFNKQEYLESYVWLIKELQAQKIETYIVRGDSYKGNKIFSNGFQLIDGEIRAITESIQVDLILNRDHKNTIPCIKDCPIINPAKLDWICTSKIETYKMFRTISPKTYLTNSFADSLSKLELIPSDRVVLKPNDGAEGRQVLVLDKIAITESCFKSWNNILVQEFVETSVGIEKICNGRHDLRVTLINGNLVHSMLRQPKTGSYVSNISQGGRSQAVNLRDLPGSVCELVRSIDLKLQEYQPRFYSIDFAKSKIGWMLIELNSHPGIGHRNFYQNYLSLNNSILSMIVDFFDSVRQRQRQREE